MELDFGEIGNVQYLLSSGPLGTLFMPSAKNLVSVQPKIGPNKTVRLKMLQAKWAKIKHFPRFFCSAPKEKRERIHSITSTPHHKPHQMKLFFFMYPTICIFYQTLDPLRQGWSHVVAWGGRGPCEIFFLSIRLWRKNKWAPPTLDSWPPYPFLNYSPSPALALVLGTPNKTKSYWPILFKYSKSK